jgi:endonuclease-3
MSASKGAAAIGVIIKGLKQAHPDATYELNWTTPLELLVATIMAAQCTDERVNQVTRSLFKKYRSAADYAECDLAELEQDIKAVTFYRNKAKAIQGACKILVERFGGKVPKSMDDLLTLPGVARKTANVVLNVAYGLPSGIIVDTHVARASKRLGLTRQDKPEKIEQDLMQLVPESDWTHFGPALVLHGRYVCTASSPKCSECMFEAVCEKNGVK